MSTPGARCWLPLLGSAGDGVLSGGRREATHERAARTLPTAHPARDGSTACLLSRPTGRTDRRVARRRDRRPCPPGPAAAAHGLVAPRPVGSPSPSPLYTPARS